MYIPVRCVVDAEIFLKNVFWDLCTRQNLAACTLLSCRLTCFSLKVVKGIVSSGKWKDLTARILD